jgi:Domain of unknown function (DUF4440)
MIKLTAYILCQFILFTALSQQKADSLAVVQLLKNDYKTLEKFDITKHIANCTPDYMLIEDGEVWTLQKELEYFRSNANRSLTRRDYFTIYKFFTSGNTAYLVYHLKSDMNEKGKVTTKNWTESAVFKKSAGTWKIALIHSTTVASKLQ